MFGGAGWGRWSMKNVAVMCVWLELCRRGNPASVVEGAMSGRGVGDGRPRLVGRRGVTVVVGVAVWSFSLGGAASGIRWRSLKGKFVVAAISFMDDLVEVLDGCRLLFFIAGSPWAVAEVVGASVSGIHHDRCFA